MSAILSSREHYDLLDQFEQDTQLKGYDREKNPESQKRGHLYLNGEVSRDFRNYRLGYSFGKRVAQAAYEPPVELCSAHLWHLVDHFATLPPTIDEDGNECDSTTPDFVVIAMLRDLRALMARYQPQEAA